MRPRTLGRRLQLLVGLVALFPLVIVGSLAIFWLIPQSRQEIDDNHREMARLVAFQVSDHLYDAERDLRSLAGLMFTQVEVSGPYFSKILDSHVSDDDFFSAIYLVDENDLVYAIGLPEKQRERRHEMLGLDMSRRQFVGEMRHSQESHWSDVFVSSMSGRLAVAYAVPLGKWLIVGEVAVEELTKYISDLPSRSHLVVVVLDGGGQVIAYSRKDFAGQRLELGKSRRLDALLLAGEDLRTFGLAGEEYMGTVEPVRQLGWSVLVAQPYSLALHPLKNMLWTLGIGLFSALILAVTAGLLISRKLAGDFANLAGQARAIAQGEYDRPLPVSGIGEFAGLGADLGKMSVAIRHREEALAESQARLIRAQSVAHVGSWEYDLASGLIWGTDEAFRIVGLPAGPDHILEFDAWRQMVAPDDRPRLDRALEDLIAQRTPYDLELQAEHGTDGQLRDLHTRAELVLAPDGSPAKVLGTIQDITEHKQLEQQLFQSQKMEAIGMLAGGVAHDFNNMLSVILGYTELLRMDVPPDSSLDKSLAEIEKAAMQSRDITRQLLAFSRKQIISPRQRNLNDLIGGTKKNLIRLIGEDVELSFRRDPDLWKVRVDPSQIDQILVNLAVNARDAMPGGGKLLIETENVVLDEGIRHYNDELKPGNYVVLSVSDAGQGMDTATKSRIFEPFFTTKAVGKGTGLGLATVYGIVKQNGGLINVYSEPGRGTTFKIYLPRYLGEDEPAETLDAALLEKGSGNVLLVEDDEQVRDIAMSMLENLGYSVESFKTPTAAIARCQNDDKRFDLLLTDVVMPEMSGKDLRDALAELKPDIAVLFMSGYTNDVIVHHGVLEKGVHFLAKPFSLNDLARKIREAMQ